MNYIGYIERFGDKEDSFAQTMMGWWELGSRTIQGSTPCVGLRIYVDMYRENEKK